MPRAPAPGYRDTVTGDHHFEVVAWRADRRLTLYVPGIEASTTVEDPRTAEDAVRGLIADLTGMEPGEITCDIRLGRPWRSGI
ncbi:hypothetical protein AFB00_28730 [Pseudonocardia sp. HH130630-07]|nr:hypothetical protein AFB00_28730 [Pseudonocardia sp. HH130630-07]